MSKFSNLNLTGKRIPVCRPIVNRGPKPKRNAACFCGSGKKYKKCCLIQTPVYKPITKKTDYAPERILNNANKVQAYLNAGADKAEIYAYIKTGNYITAATTQLFPEADVAEWENHVNAYNSADAEVQATMLDAQEECNDAVP